MDKLEKMKADNLTNDAITDDVAAKAYIENFALETFNRADDAQRANKVTKQTADTFMAAATFLDLLSIWGEVDKEIAAKSKFAKFHALRIAKAFKTGEDPNATNPVVEQPPVPADDGIEAELKDLERQESTHADNVYRSPTVEAVPPNDSPMGSAHIYSSAPNVPPPFPQEPSSDTVPAPAVQEEDHEVSPIEPIGSTTERQNSIGGGYFPAVESTPMDADVPSSMDVGSTDHMSAGIPDFMDSGVPGASAGPAQSPQPPAYPQQFYNTATQPAATPSSGFYGINSRNSFQHPSTSQTRASVQPMQSPPVPRSYAPQPPLVQAPVPASAPAPVQQAYHTGPYKTDDESTMAAQKHARWAISALNFEDVNTAVKELRLALQNLGAG